MTMNIHLTMTMNILFTIMWMQTTTVEEGRHPVELAGSVVHLTISLLDQRSDPRSDLLKKRHPAL